MHDKNVNENLIENNAQADALPPLNQDQKKQPEITPTPEEVEADSIPENEKKLDSYGQYLIGLMQKMELY